MVWRDVFSANGLKNDAVPFMGLVTINGLGCYDNDDDGTIRIVQSGTFLLNSWVWGGL